MHILNDVSRSMNNFSAKVRLAANGPQKICGLHMAFPANLKQHIVCGYDSGKVVGRRRYGIPATNAIAPMTTEMASSVSERQSSFSCGVQNKPYLAMEEQKKDVSGFDRNHSSLAAHWGKFHG